MGANGFGKPEMWVLPMKQNQGDKGQQSLCVTADKKRKKQECEDENGAKSSSL